MVGLILHLYLLTKLAVVAEVELMLLEVMVDQVMVEMVVLVDKFHKYLHHMEALQDTSLEAEVVEEMVDLVGLVDLEVMVGEQVEFLLV